VHPGHGEIITNYWQLYLLLLWTRKDSTGVIQNINAETVMQLAREDRRSAHYYVETDLNFTCYWNNRI